MKICHECGKKIPNRLNYIKEPTFYFKQVRKDKEDCLYWCDWKCLEKHIKNRRGVKILIAN